MITMPVSRCKCGMKGCGKLCFRCIWEEEKTPIDTDEPGGDFTGAGDWNDNITKGR